MNVELKKHEKREIWESWWYLTICRQVPFTSFVRRCTVFSFVWDQHWCVAACCVLAACCVACCRVACMLSCAACWVLRARICLVYDMCVEVRVACGLHACLSRTAWCVIAWCSRERWADSNGARRKERKRNGDSHQKNPVTSTTPCPLYPRYVICFSFQTKSYFILKFCNIKNILK